MKNQYVGDVGDFGKYSLLRAFSEAGVAIGVNWYLTEDDGSDDGKFTSYLQDEGMRRRCPEVFDVLKSLASEPDKSVNDVQRSGMISNAQFFDEIIKVKGAPSERKYQRNEWFSRSVKALANMDLIFMDPDNGLLKSNDASKLGAEKYALLDEVEQYFNAGHNVVYYCHKGRRTFEAWQEYKSMMFERIPAAKPTIITYHKGTQRSYIFLIHEEDFVKYRKIIDRFLGGWYRVFSEEYTKKGNAAETVVGETFSVKKSDGTIVTIQNRADGKIQIKSSSKPNTTTIMTADSFCGYMGV